MPEIYYDELFFLIKEYVKNYKPKTILEIGSWDGTGSTLAFLQGVTENNLQNDTSLFCLEAQKDRFEKLLNNTISYSFVKCYNRLSGNINDLRSEQEISDFMDKYPQLIISQNPKEKVFGWRKEEDVWPVGVPDNGVTLIKEENNIKDFDMVLLDGSEFTGVADFKLTRNSGIFILDDINAMKNYENYLTLQADNDYSLIQESWQLRNGYAVFIKD